ncbi:MAG: hypothetical protein AB8B59_02595 [Maribacter sp.]
MKSTKMLIIILLCFAFSVNTGCNKETDPKPVDEDSMTDSPAGASGFRLSSRSIMKFGILYQNEGKCGKEQLVPKMG